MLRRIPLIVLLTAAMLVPAAASLADERPPAPRPSISMTAPSTGMAEVPIAFHIGATPAALAGKSAVALQVKTSTGFVTRKRLMLDARGRVTGSLVSKRAAERTYRAVLLSRKGKAISTSAPVSVTWTPLVHTASLECARSIAPIGVDVPCTITVSPAVRLDDMVSVLQVMGRTGWVLVEADDVPSRGVVHQHVTGTEAGVGNYRVLILRDDVVQAESPAVSITYS